MGMKRAVTSGLLGFLGVLSVSSVSTWRHQNVIQQQNETLLQELQRVHRLSDAQINGIRKIFAK